RADGFVHGVVAADVLGGGEEAPLDVEDGGAVRAAGAGEGALLGAEAVRGGGDQVGGDGWGVGDAAHAGEEVVHAAPSADAARGGGEGAAAGGVDLLQLQLDARGGGELDEVAVALVVRAAAVGDGAEVGGGVDDAFGEQEAHREVEV